MKNKGRRHKHGLQGIWDCKGYLGHLTRPIESMSSKGTLSKFDGKLKKIFKKKWSKRVRGYMKTQKYKNFIQSLKHL